jgi:hypothetical protein
MRWVIRAEAEAVRAAGDVTRVLFFDLIGCTRLFLPEMRTGRGICAQVLADKWQRLSHS